MTFGYDANGNITSENAKAYTFNQNNRLVLATGGAATGEYTLNAKEQRATKTVNGQATVFHHDQAGRIVAESLAAGATTVEYVYMNGQPLAKAEGAALSFIHTDHLGTPTVMTNGAAVPTWQIEARPFGDADTIIGTGTLNLRFPGQYLDQETALHQNWHREYNPTVGRYLSEDPIARLAALNHYSYADLGMGRFIREDPIGGRGRRDLYAYAGDDPVDLVDPFGLRPCEPNPRSAYYSCCRGGRPTLCRGPYWDIYHEQKVRKCMIRHEYVHVEDLCDKCRNHPDGPLCIDDETKQRTECRAYRDTLDCLTQRKPETEEERNLYKVAELGVNLYCFNQRIP